MKINLEKACIGFLVGILIYCVCNKKFLIEGINGQVNTCRELSPATCDEEKLCYVEGDKVCSANDQKQCKGEGFRWCGTGGKVETCDGKLEHLCGQHKGTVFDCAECAGDNQQALKSAGCSTDNIAAWCAGVQPPSPPGPPSQDNPNQHPPIEFNRGYIEYKNDHPSKKIIIWFDQENPGTTQYIDPIIEFRKNSINNNIKIIDESGQEIPVDTVKRSTNGFVLSPRMSLFLKLSGEDTKIQSGGNYFTNEVVPEAPNTTNTNRFEYTIISKEGWAEGKTMVTANYSYVNGYNSFFTLRKSINNSEYVDFGGLSCNISDLSETTCNANGGTYSNIAPGEVGGLTNQKNCFNPGKAMNSDNTFKYKSTAVGGDPIGCDGVQNLPPNYACNCLQTWYSNPGSKYYVSPDLIKWYKYIHNNCPSGYAWSYHEKEPANLNDPIYNDENWCSNLIQGGNNGRTWSDIAEYLKDSAKGTDGNPLFVEPPVLSIDPIVQGDILKILITIKDIM